jgi:predicted TIM-barrel fold metal-dependent hydrolase
MDATGISQSVPVQATTAYGYDNSYVRDSAVSGPDRFLAVGTLDPLRPEAAAALASAVSEGGLAGVRLFTGEDTQATQGEWFAAPEMYESWQRAQDLGADQIAWGSDYPAAEESLPELVELAPNTLAGLPDTDQTAIFAGTPRRLCPSLNQGKG